MQLLEKTRIKDYLIDLLKNKQPLYSLIYSLKPVKLEILNTYINVNLASDFISLSKSSTTTVILFTQKKIVAFVYA